MFCFSRWKVGEISISEFQSSQNFIAVSSSSFEKIYGVWLTNCRNVSLSIGNFSMPWQKIVLPSDWFSMNDSIAFSPVPYPISSMLILWLQKLLSPRFINMCIDSATAPLILWYVSPKCSFLRVQEPSSVLIISVFTRQR